MHLSSILFFSVAVIALPRPSSDYVPVVRPWMPALPTDSRSPCPLLNTLANHGYLPQDGRNITAEDFGNAIHDALAFDTSFGVAQANLQLQKLNKQIVDLEDLNAHEVVEHRASISRKDAPADTIHVDPLRLPPFLADADNGYHDVSSLIKTRNRVESLSGAPPLTVALAQQSAGEAGLILLAMADGEVPATPTNGTADYSGVRAPADRVDAWLRNERLPVELGWKPAPRPYVIGDLVGLAAAVSAGVPSTMQISS